MTNTNTPKAPHAGIEGWENVSGSILIYCNKVQSKAGGYFWGFSTSLTGKDRESGAYIRKYIPVRFARGCVTLPDGTSADAPTMYEGMNRCIIKKGFLTVDSNKELKIVIMEASPVVEFIPRKNAEPGGDAAKFAKAPTSAKAWEPVAGAKYTPAPGAEQVKI